LSVLIFFAPHRVHDRFKYVNERARAYRALEQPMRISPDIGPEAIFPNDEKSRRRRPTNG